MKTKPTHSSVSNDVDGLTYSSSGNKNKKKMKKAIEDNKKIKIAQQDLLSSDSSNKTTDKRKKLKKTKQTQITDNVNDNHSNQQTTDNMDVAKSNKKMKKASSNKKRKGAELPEAETTEVVVSAIPEDAHESKKSDGRRDKQTGKTKKKKRDKESRKKDSARENVPRSDDADQQTEDNMDVAKSNKKMKKASSNKKRKGAELPEAETTQVVVSAIPEDAHESKKSDGKRDKKTKTSKTKKKKRDKESRKKDSARENVPHSDDADQQSGALKSTSQLDNGATLFEDEDEVYEMSSGDEDETTGMKRWITKYHRARPGAEVLMENINDFLVDYAAQKEREKKEREEEAAEGGWTVVTHVKGRKKTTEAESGTTVGSVAPAAVMDKLSKKKDKQVGQDFYRFQKREAQRNELMTLQSKFEQDKKRIQELRAARKFRPY